MDRQRTLPLNAGSGGWAKLSSDTASRRVGDNAQCREVTANLTDKRRTNVKGLIASYIVQALDLVLLRVAPTGFEPATSGL